MAPIKWLFKSGTNQLSLTALMPGQAQAPEAKVKITLTVQSQGFVGSGSGSVSKEQWSIFLAQFQQLLIQELPIQKLTIDGANSGASAKALLTSEKLGDFMLEITPSAQADLFFLQGQLGRSVSDAQKSFTHQLQFGFSCPIASDAI
jgi:hypothetical protein